MSVTVGIRSDRPRKSTSPGADEAHSLHKGGRKTMGQLRLPRSSSWGTRCRADKHHGAGKPKRGRPSKQAQQARRSSTASAASDCTCCPPVSGDVCVDSPSRVLPSIEPGLVQETEVLPSVERDGVEDGNADAGLPTEKHSSAGSAENRDSGYFSSIFADNADEWDSSAWEMMPRSGDKQANAGPSTTGQTTDYARGWDAVSDTARLSYSPGSLGKPEEEPWTSWHSDAYEQAEPEETFPALLSPFHNDAFLSPLLNSEYSFPSCMPPASEDATGACSTPHTLREAEAA